MISFAQMQGASSDHVVWDIVEEHLDEAEFGFERFEQMLDHPLLTLDDLTRSVEERWLAHLDALLIAGDPAVEKLLGPQLAAAGEQDAARAGAAALALTLARKHLHLTAGLSHPLSAVRRATLRGCELAGSVWLQPWALDRFREGREVVLTCVADRLEPTDLLKGMQSGDPEIASDALAAASRRELGPFGPIATALLEHEHAGVRDAALLAGLIWGLPNAWPRCQQAALDVSSPSALAMQLYAALGGHAQATRLAELLDSPQRRHDALFALSFSGDVKLVPELLPRLRSADALEAKLAAQAIAGITGLDLRDDQYALPIETGDAADLDEAAEALPALDEDEELELPPEDALPRPDAAAILEYWRRESARFDPAQRYFAGQPLTVPGVLDYLERGSLRLRHGLARMLAIRTGGAARLDTRALVGRQRTRIEELRALGLRSFSR